MTSRMPNLLLKPIAQHHKVQPLPEVWNLYQKLHQSMQKLHFHLVYMIELQTFLQTRSNKEENHWTDHCQPGMAMYQ